MPVYIEVGSADWNLLEDIINRNGAVAVTDAVQRIMDGNEDEDEA